MKYIIPHFRQIDNIGILWHNILDALTVQIAHRRQGGIESVNVESHLRKKEATVKKYIAAAAGHEATIRGHFKQLQNAPKNIEQKEIRIALEATLAAYNSGGLEGAFYYIDWLYNSLNAADPNTVKGIKTPVLRIIELIRKE